MTLSNSINETTIEPKARRHDIDALRVLAFAVLILYHVGMFYVADWGWHIKSTYTVDWLKFPMLLVNQWRMALLFLISGAVVNFLLDKVTAGRFAWLRFKRLFIPLVFGMLVIVPPQAWLEAQANGAFDGSYLAFLGQYFSFRSWPEGAFAGVEIGITWNHLWFLPYLMTYTLLLTALLPLLRGAAGQRLLIWFRSARGPALFLLPALPFIVIHTLLGDVPETHAYIDDPRAHLTYFCVFLLGFILGRDAGLWRELVRWRWVALGLAMVSYSTLITVLLLEVDLGLGMPVLRSYNGWFWLMAVLGWGAYALNRPFRGLAYATEAVVSWYLLHQTLTVLLGAGLTPYALGPVVEPILVLGGTVLGCLVIHEYVVRRVAWMRPLFGLKPRASTGQPVPGIVLDHDAVRRN